MVEFQVGLRPSMVATTNLCDKDRFLQRTWRTQARRSPLPLSSCPIAGEYTGNLPDAPSRFCAKMSSDCNNPDVIFYSVFSCANSSQIFEGGFCTSSFFVPLPAT